MVGWGGQGDARRSQMAPPTAETVSAPLVLLFTPGIHTPMLPLGLISLSGAEKQDLEGGMLIRGCFPQLTRAWLSRRGLAEVGGPGDMLPRVGRHFSCPSSPVKCDSHTKSSSGFSSSLSTSQTHSSHLFLNSLPSVLLLFKIPCDAINELVRGIKYGPR